MTRDDEWRVWVTEDDVRLARAAWLRARDGGAAPDRVLDLLEELERVTRTAAIQSAGDRWSTGVAASRVAAAGDVPHARRLLRPPARLSAAG